MANEMVVTCPTCGAKSKQSGFGRDSTRREIAPLTMKLSDDPTVSRRRNRAKTLAVGQGSRHDK